MTSLVQGARSLVRRDRPTVGERLEALDAAVASARGRIHDPLVDRAEGVVRRGQGRLALSADDKTLAVGSNTQGVELWDLERRTLRRTIPGHHVTILALAFVAVEYRSFQISPAEKAARTLDAADALVAWPYDGPITQTPDGGGIGYSGTLRPAHHTMPRCWPSSRRGAG